MSRNKEGEAMCDTIQTRTGISMSLYLSQMRVFLDSMQKKGFPRGKLIRSPHQPGTFPLNKKKKSRACSFEGCFLSSLLHPPLISSSAFVAGLLPPAERAGCTPGACSCQGPRTHPTAARPSSRCLRPASPQPCSITSGTSGAPARREGLGNQVQPK